MRWDLNDEQRKSVAVWWRSISLGILAATVFKAFEGGTHLVDLAAKDYFDLAIYIFAASLCQIWSLIVLTGVTD